MYRIASHIAITVNSDGYEDLIFNTV